MRYADHLLSCVDMARALTGVSDRELCRAAGLGHGWLQSARRSGTIVTSKADAVLATIRALAPEGADGDHLVALTRLLTAADVAQRNSVPHCPPEASEAA